MCFDRVGDQCLDHEWVSPSIQCLHYLTDEGLSGTRLACLYYFIDDLCVFSNYLINSILYILSGKCFADKAK